MALSKVEKRLRIKRRVRKHIYGTQARPRLSVYKSNKDIYAQLVNDDDSITLVSFSSRNKGFDSSGTKVEQSKSVGIKVAELAKEKGIESVVFDRNGFVYHGRVRSLAEGAREGGLKF